MKFSLIYLLLPLMLAGTIKGFTQSTPSIQWINIQGLTAKNNNLQKVTKTNKWGNAGTASTNLLPSNTDGWISTTAQETNTARMIGFSQNDKNQDWQTIDYALYLTAKGNVEIREKGSKTLHTTTYKTGDLLKIERIVTTIYYKKNDTTIYTSTKKSTSELIIDISMKTEGATLQNILASFPVPKNSNDTLITKSSKNRQLEHWKIHNIRGKISQEGNYLNSQKTGIWKTYHLNGQLQKITQYQEGKIIGVEQEFTDRGIPIVQTNHQFANDTIIEIISKRPKIEQLTIYDEVGKLKHTGFLENGGKTGIWREFTPNGQVKTFTTYDSDKKNGLHYVFDAKGGIIEEINYQEDVLEGKRIKYKLHGNKVYKTMLVEHYHNGKLDGVFENYYGNGAMQESSMYQNGTKNGKSIWYHKNGEVLSEFEYKNGVLTGRSKGYYADGKIKTESNYSSNKLEGSYKEYHTNGNLKREGQYVQGKKDGKWSFYDEQGKLSKREWYEKGELMKNK